MIELLGGTEGGGTTLRLGAFGGTFLPVLIFRGVGRGAGSPTSLDKERKQPSPKIQADENTSEGIRKLNYLSTAGPIKMRAI